MKRIENYIVMPIKTIKITCGECDGRGRILELDGDGYESEVECFSCGGSGEKEKEI